MLCNIYVKKTHPVLMNLGIRTDTPLFFIDLPVQAYNTIKGLVQKDTLEIYTVAEDPYLKNLSRTWVSGGVVLPEIKIVEKIVELPPRIVEKIVEVPAQSLREPVKADSEEKKSTPAYTPRNVDEEESVDPRQQAISEGFDENIQTFDETGNIVSEEAIRSQAEKSKSSNVNNPRRTSWMDNDVEGGMVEIESDGIFYDENGNPVTELAPITVNEEDNDLVKELEKDLPDPVTLGHNVLTHLTNVENIDTVDNWEVAEVDWSEPTDEITEVVEPEVKEEIVIENDEVLINTDVTFNDWIKTSKKKKKKKAEKKDFVEAVAEVVPEAVKKEEEQEPEVVEIEATEEDIQQFEREMEEVK